MKVFTVVALLLTYTFASAQEFRRVKVGIGIGFPSYYPSLAYLEPAYRVTDAWAIGFRLEGGQIDSKSGFILTGSYGINGQYYFSKNKVRSFAGLGLSLYSPSHAIGSLCDCSSTFERNKLGFYPRLGLDFGHLSLNLEYNFVPSSKERTISTIPGNNGQTYVEYISNSYFAMKLGALIGGGRRK